MILMTFAPKWMFSRMAFFISSRVSAKMYSGPARSRRSGCSSIWPPNGPIMRPALTMVGPATIVNAGRIIGPFGGQMLLQPERRDLAGPEYIFADTRDEMKKAIRENIHFGAKVIKIIADGYTYAYSVDDMKFIV